MKGRLILHEYAESGTCYKVRLTAALLGIALDRREYDILKGETRTPESLREDNANGRIPVRRTATASSRRAMPPVTISRTRRG